MKEETFFSKAFVPAGIVNSGYLCYLNSLLQVFGSSTHWQRFFERCPNTNSTVVEIRNIVMKLSESFNFGTKISTKSMRKKLESSGLSVDVFRQQDLHEFYGFMLEVISNSLNQYSTYNYCSFSTRRIFPTDLIYEEIVQCPSCRSSSAFINQTSSIIVNSSFGSLNDALQDFFGPSFVNSQCSHCKRTLDRHITRKISIVPKSIFIFINRGDSMTGLPSMVPFEYPYSLNIQQFSQSDEIRPPPDNGLLKNSYHGLSESIIYDKPGFNLTAVVNFLGSDNSGHYYTYRIHREKGGLCSKQWVCANDSQITPIPIQTVMSARKQCLLLHYELSV